MIKSQRVRFEAVPESGQGSRGHGDCQPSARLIPVDAHAALVEVTCSCGEQLTLELALDAGNPNSANHGAAAPRAAAPTSHPSPTGAQAPEAQ
ncbi:MAG: hypothetical protein ACYS26_12765 [Planctomycetota bacterium]